VTAVVRNRYDIGMRELRHALRFNLEALNDAFHNGLRELVQAHELDGDVSLQVHMAGFVDLGHTAPAQGGENLVALDARAGCDGHICFLIRIHCAAKTEGIIRIKCLSNISIKCYW